MHTSPRGGSAAVLLKHLPQLALRRADDQTPAGLWMTSLPWPRATARTLSLGGHATWCQPLGQWHGVSRPQPRRLLLVADGANAAPEALSLRRGTPAVAAAPPQADMVRFGVCEESGFMWERHSLRLQHGGLSIGLALGLRTGGEVHWWEACRLVTVSESPFCRVVHMAGAIPHRLCGVADLQREPGYRNWFLHRHNWLNGELVVRLYANGVCEVFARHVNSKFHDGGRDLEDVVPVVGFCGPGLPAAAGGLCGTWDGSRRACALGAVQCDMGEAARLATPERPGAMAVEGEFLVWQPYAGVELFGGVCPEQVKGDPWLVRASQRLFPRGLARTLRFSLSLNPQRSPHIARYLAPYWWYGVTEELTPQPYLPVSNAYDAVLDRDAAWVREHIVRGGFEDGAVPRHQRPAPPAGELHRHEAGWEGEVPYGQFLNAYRTGSADDYHSALRSAYHVTDIAVDHAAKQLRMHGYTLGAFAPPMNRVLGTLMAYLETGDPYLFDTAEAVTEAAFRVHMNSWPRLGVGRDACFVRGAVMLYRYFNDEHFRRLAHDGAMTVVQSQREDGSFGDQGGGTGIHAWGGYITKPWMGLLATNGLLDYLELFPEDAPLAACIQRFGDWLMRARWTRNGFTGWSYQHDFNGLTDYFDFYRNRWVKLPSPDCWHQENLGRLLGVCALRSGNAAYLDAWAENQANAREAASDHRVSAAFQFLPWVQAHLWRATLKADNTVAIQPVHFGPRTPATAEIVAPTGCQRVVWDGAEAKFA